MPQSFKNNFKSTDPKMVSLSVYNVGFQQCDPSYSWGPGIRDHFLIHHIVSGSGSYTVEDTTYELTAGDSFLVYPYTPVFYKADENDPWEYYWAGFAGADAALIIHSTPFTRKKPILHADSKQEDEQIRQLIMNIYSSRGNTLENSVAMTGALYTFLAYYLKDARNDFIENNLYSGYLKKATNYVEANYSYPINVESIAAHVGVSRSHLFRVFKKYLEISPKEYLTEYRLRQACSLLKSTDLSVTAIALSTGFEDNLYFSKAFKKSRGCPPSEYRNLH